jgi:hypothetical protein
METRRGGAKRKEDERLEHGPLAKRTRSNYQNAAFEPVALTQEPRAKKKGPSKPPLPVPPAAAGGDMDRNKRDNSTDNRRNPDNGGDDDRVSYP